MKAIVVEEECHGDIKVCADMRSAFEYLLIGGWLTTPKPIPESVNDLMAEYERNPDFLDGEFYFHEIDIYQSKN